MMPLSAGMLALLATLVVWFGGDAPAARFVAVAGASGLGLLMLVKGEGAPAAPQSLLRWLRWGVALPLASVLLFCATALLPATWLPWGNPAVWENLPQSPLWPSVSVAPFQTFTQFLLAGGYAVLGWVAFRLGRTPQAPSFILKGVVALSALTAAYGLTTYMLGIQRILWLPKTAFLRDVTGPFIYHNAFAAFMALGMLATMALMLERVGEVSRRLPLRQRIKAFYWMVLRPRGGLLAVWFLMALALVLSNSRAGVASALVAHLVFWGGLLVARPGARVPLGVLVGGLCVLGAMALGLNGAVLGARMNELTETPNVRSAIYTLTANMVKEAPLTGTGLGTFQPLFPMAKQAQVSLWVPGLTEHAHSFYLETAAELGLPATALLLVALTVVLALLLNGLRLRRRLVIWPALGVSVVIYMMIHSVVDFMLAIPALAATTIVLTGLALGTSVPPLENAEPLAHRPKLPLLGATLALLALGLWGAVAEAFSFKPTLILRHIEAGESLPPETLQTAQNGFTQCLSLMPINATCAEGLAATQISQAAQLFKGSPEQAARLHTAQTGVENALALAPSNGVLWFRLSQLNAMQNNDSSATTALTQSVIYAPLELPLAVTRTPLTLRLWPAFTPEDKTLLKANLSGLYPFRRWNMNHEIFVQYAAPLSQTLATRLQTLVHP